MPATIQEVFMYFLNYLSQLSYKLEYYYYLHFVGKEIEALQC